MTSAECVPDPRTPAAYLWLVNQLEALSVHRYGQSRGRFREGHRAASGRCPFHDDFNPSMSVFGRREPHPRFECYASSCGAHGDAIDLAQRLGVDVSIADFGSIAAPGTATMPGAEARSHAWDRSVARHFLETLPALTSLPAGSAQRSYLAARGVRRETLDALDVRAPVRQHPYVAQKHAQLDSDGQLAFVATAESLGLCRLNLTGYETRYGSKVLVPVTDLAGDLHLICGRTSQQNCAVNRRYQRWNARARDDEPMVLWPINGPGVVDAIRESGVVILVPGFVEAMCLWQAGVRNVLALLGDRVPTDTEFRILRTIGAERVVFALHLDQEDGSRDRADTACAVAGVVWGMPSLVDAFRDEMGDTQDADELPPDRLPREAARLVVAVRAEPAITGGELGVVAAARGEAVRSIRMRHSYLKLLVARYRGLKRLAGHRRVRAFIDAEFPIRLRPPASAPQPGSFAIPDIKRAVQWKTTLRDTGDVDLEMGVPYTWIVQEPPVLELLVLLRIAAAQASAWGRGSRRGVPIRLSTFAKAMGVTISAVAKAITRLKGWGAVAQFKPFVPVGGESGRGGRTRRRYRSHRYVAILRPSRVERTPTGPVPIPYVRPP